MYVNNIPEEHFITQRMRVVLRLSSNWYQIKLKLLQSKSLEIYEECNLYMLNMLNILDFGQFNKFKFSKLSFDWQI